MAVRTPTTRSDKPFDFSLQMERLVRDIARRCPAFAHIDPGRMLFCISQARSGSSVGTYAKVVPLRFEDGRKTRRFGQRLYRMPTVRRRGRDILYLVYFYLPRFQDAPFVRKLQIVFHELYHVSPQFDGDLRRFPGRKFLHGPSEKAYDRTVSEIMETYLALPGRDGCSNFLHHSFDALERRYGGVVGYSVRNPAAYRVARAR